jgi:PKD repeat protein
MKTILRLTALAVLLPSLSLLAQNSLPTNANRSAHQLSINGTLPGDANTIGQSAPTGEQVQMTTCTDKLTYVDRHPGTPDDLPVGGVTGWPIVLQAYPGYTGQITEAYATMKKYGTNTSSMAVAIYQLNSSGVPSGSPLSTITVSVNSTAYTEYGGVLGSAVTISSNGFAVAVYAIGASDSALVGAHDDPEGNDLSYLFDGTTLETTYNLFFVYYDWLLRAKISYTGPSITTSATPSSGCPGTPVNFNYTQTGLPSWYSAVWASTTADTYNWTFGDAGTSTQQYPSHTYSASGTFTVNTTVNYSGWTTSCPATGSTTVSMNGASPAVSIMATSTVVCLADNVTFQATPTAGGSGPTYTWKKNGFQVGTGVTYSASGFVAGDQVICEMVSNDPCATSAPVTSNTITMAVQPGSISAFTFMRTGLTVNFTNAAQNATTFLWDYGDSGTGTAPNPSHTYASPATYTAQLTTTNVCNATNASSINITVTASGNSSGGNVGVNEQSVDINANSFPNPADGELNLVYTLTQTNDLTIEVVNALGQVVSVQVVQNASTGTIVIPMETLPAGLYMIRLTAGNDQSVLHVVHQ